MEQFNENLKIFLISILIAGWGVDCSHPLQIFRVSGGGSSPGSPLEPLLLFTEILVTVSNLAINLTPLFHFALHVLLILNSFDKILDRCEALKSILINIVSFKKYYVIFLIISY